MKNKNELLKQIVELSFKMRLLKARKSGDNFKLKERDVLILELLEKYSGISGGEIGAYFKGFSLSTISVDLKNLRNLGFVKKSIDSYDERRFCFSLTKKGVVLVQEVRNLRMKMFKPIIDALNDNDSELKIICDFVNRTIKGIELLSEQI